MDERIVSGLSSRLKFFLKFLGSLVAGWVVVTIVFDLFRLDEVRAVYDTTSLLMWAVILAGIVGGVLSLLNLFFGDSEREVRPQLLNAAAAAGFVLGAAIGCTPALLPSSGHATGGLGLASLLFLALVPVGLGTVALGLAIAFVGLYPRMAGFITGAGIGVLSGIGALFSSRA